MDGEGGEFVCEFRVTEGKTVGGEARARGREGCVCVCGNFRPVVGCVPRLRAEQAGAGGVSHWHRHFRGETLQTLDAAYQCGVALLTVQGTEGVAGVSGPVWRVGRPERFGEGNPAIRQSLAAGAEDPQ